MADDDIWLRLTLNTRFFHFDGLVRNDLTTEFEGGLNIENVNQQPISRTARRYFWIIYWSWFWAILYFLMLTRYYQPLTDFTVFLEPCNRENVFAVEEFDNLRHGISGVQKDIKFTKTSLKYNITPDATIQLQEKLKSLNSNCRNLILTFQQHYDLRLKCYKENVQVFIDSFTYSFVMLATILMIINHIKCFYFIDKTKEAGIPHAYGCVVITVVNVVLDIIAYRKTIMISIDSDMYIEKFPIGSLFNGETYFDFS